MRWIVLAVMLAGCVPHVPSVRYLAVPTAPVAVAPEALAGTWYEVAAYPAPFQQGCTHTTATYAVQPDGNLSVLNRCRRGGGLVQIAGLARPVAPGVLQVRLEGAPFAGDYRVLATLRQGRVVVVGTQTRIAGWVLSRDRMLRDPRLFDEAREVFRRNGYDPAALERTDQR